MAYNRNRNRNRNRTTFPDTHWDVALDAVAEMPNFFEIRDWRMIPVDPPPGPQRTAEELQKLLRRQNEEIEERLRRRPEIEQEASGVCPYFNRLLSFDSHPGSYVLMEAMFELGTVVVTHYKKRFMRLRPSHLEPQLRPMIDVPQHASYPSGHALQYFLVAKALASVVRDQVIGSELFQIAQRVAENREWAGLHFMSDTEVGKQIAFAIFPQVRETYVRTFENAARDWI